MEELRIKLENLKGMSYLKDCVIDIVLNHIDEYDEPDEYFESVLYGGCENGMVGELTYYYQTEEFFDIHHEEIFEIYNEYQVNNNLYEFRLSKNSLAWFGFEETLRNLVYELDLEI